MKFKRTFFFFFCLLGGIVSGAMVAGLCASVPFLSWLSYHSTIGFEPVTLDLSIMQLTIGFRMGISVAQICTIALAMFCYNRSNIK